MARLSSGRPSPVVAEQGTIGAPPNQVQAHLHSVEQVSTAVAEAAELVAELIELCLLVLHHFVSLFGELGEQLLRFF